MSGTKNSKELYKEVFSKLHASETVIREEEKMKNVKSRFRCSRLAAACISLALLMGATSGITYAATDGATANPSKPSVSISTVRNMMPRCRRAMTDTSYI